jgi:glucose/arabinose dehydrogenase
MRHSILILMLAAGSCAGQKPQSLDASLQILPAFPEHPRWRRPLYFGACSPATSKDAAMEHVVAEQGGRVHVFTLDRSGRAGEPGLFLDLSDAVTTRGNEEGLLGLAFHPRFAENGRCFAYYSAADRACTRLSEFATRRRGHLEADPASERALLEIDQPYSNHNGGQLAFGPDGMLYVGVGDGGSAGDPQNHAQDPGSLLGKILRVDVDAWRSKSDTLVPADNPFAGQGGARGEVWALGLRNPWRFSFDPLTGALWAGDVGQDAWEEVDVVEAGGNYGWPLKEGCADFDRRRRRGPGDLREPALAYSHRDGQSITGGFVYRGEGLPSLRGQYVFADYMSARVWSVDAEHPSGRRRELARISSVSSFGLDAWGELVILSFDGRLYRFAPAD